MTEFMRGNEFASLPAGVYVCQACGTGQGYIWPMASNGDDSHYFVERCDLCERFDSDVRAAEYLAERLQAEGFKFDFGYQWTDGRPYPYIENIEEA